MQFRITSIAPNNAKSRLYLLPMMLLVAAAALLFVLSFGAKETKADPFAGCDTRGFLFQYPGANTDIHAIDMVTGEDIVVGSIMGRHVNAVGYNVVDNFFYGWDNQANTLVRVHTDASADPLAVNGYTGTGSVIIGDVDENGHYWFIEGNGSNGTDWFQVDLNPGSTFLDILSQGTVSGVPVGNSAGADWAYVPGGAGLYRVMHDTGANQGRLLVFDRSSGAFNDLGLVTGIPSHDLKEGAFYADADGFLYASDNDDGNIYRVDVDAVTATLFSAGPASSSNDGARCANAHIPIDFGDAPDSYGTTLASDGARHGVPSYNVGNHTAPLMLGKRIDIETDGFPGPSADGDDLNNINDEDGVQHIVATPDVPTAMSVPVTVTNNTGNAATLAGWIDLDGNGMFDAGERVTVSIPANSGTAVYELDFPETTFTDNSYARFRVFPGTVADPQPTGSATGGEVEDYLVQVGTYEVTKTSDPASGSTVAPGDTITYTLTITNTGLTDLVNLALHDDLADVLDDAVLDGAPIISPESAGIAVIDNDALELTFTGDVLTGQSVTVTYAVKVDTAGTTGNGQVRNMVIAAHSNCHPVVEGSQIVAASGADCQTTHTLALADTGTNPALFVVIGAGLLGAATAIYLLWKRQSKLATK